MNGQCQRYQLEDRSPIWVRGRIENTLEIGLAATVRATMSNPVPITGSIAAVPGKRSRSRDSSRPDANEHGADKCEGWCCCARDRGNEWDGECNQRHDSELLRASWCEVEGGLRVEG